MGYLLLWGLRVLIKPLLLGIKPPFTKTESYLASGDLQVAPSSSEPLSLPVSSIMPCLHLRSDLQHRIKCVVVHACNSSAWPAKAEESLYCTVYPMQAPRVRWEALGKTGRHPSKKGASQRLFLTCDCNVRPYQICSLKVLETKRSIQELPDRLQEGNCRDGAVRPCVSECIKIWLGGWGVAQWQNSC